MTARSSVRRTATLTFKVAISASLLGLLLWKTDIGRLLTLFRSLEIPLFTAAVILYLIGQILSALRWQVLLQAEGIRLPFLRVLALYFEGMFFNLFLPTLIGGDVVRGYRVYTLTEKREASLASILVERLTGFACMIVIALLALTVGFSTFSDPAVTAVLLATTALFVALIGSLISERLKAFLFRLASPLRFFSSEGFLQNLYEAVQRYTRHTRALVVAFLLSLIFQSLIVVIYYVIARAIHLTVPLLYFFLFIPVITILSMVPVSLSGLGVREGSAVLLFAKIGVNMTDALTLALLWFAVTVITSSLGSVPFLLSSPPLRQVPSVKADP